MTPDKTIKPQLSFWKDSLKPRFVFPVYWLALLVTLPALLRGMLQGRRASSARPLLLIESGIRGWEGIFFQEVLTSAREYLGNHSVRVSKIDRNKKYSRQFKASLGSESPSHFFFDPRTTSDRAPRALFQAVVVALTLLGRGVTPIVFLTDASSRSWRMQSAVVTAWRGVVVTCISAREIGGIFPHRRLVGPVLMPLSEETLDTISPSHKQELQTSGTPRVGFVGWAYSPRKEWLEELQRVLAHRGIKFEIHNGKSDTTNAEYWQLLQETSILVTTSMQISRPEYDWTWKPQVVFRYIEALAASAVLVATEVPGLERYLTSGVHFHCYTSIEECADTVQRLVENEVDRRAVMEAGHARVSGLIRSHSFWRTVDEALGPKSLT